MMRWRQRLSEENLQTLFLESLAVSVKLWAAKPRNFVQAIVDTSVQDKNLVFPTDAKLIRRARAADRIGRGSHVAPSYVCVGKAVSIVFSTLRPCQTV